MKNILVSGGMGFIGSEVVNRLLDLKYNIINIDKLTYASNKERLETFKAYKNHYFHKIDIVDKTKLKFIFNKYKPGLIINIAAESHVDNSIKEPENFIDTNIIGTYNLLLETNKLKKKKLTQNSFKYLLMKFTVI